MPLRSKLLDHFAIVSRPVAPLAERLKHYAKRSDVVVLALPRGGLPIRVEVAAALRAALDV